MPASSLRRRGHAAERSADVIVCGGGLGGVAAAIAACRNGLKAILTEETDWIGGQLTAQGVPPDEHAWIERFGCTRAYRSLREGIRDYYRRFFPLTEEARMRSQLNPGNGSVSRLCHEPRVALAVLEAMLARWTSTGQLTILREHRPVAADFDGDRVKAIKVRGAGTEDVLSAPWFVDATELGDLLPLAGVEFVTGSEGRAATGELHATERADPANQQAFTVCLAMDYRVGENHTIDRPREYAAWREFVPKLTPPWTGRLLSFECPHPRTLERRTLGFDPTRDATPAGMNLWTYRRLAAAANFEANAHARDLSLVNWPQNDCFVGNLVGVSRTTFERNLERARRLSLSLLYWLQTEAPRPDGRTGWPGLRLRGDVFGTKDGLAKYPYIRESRRIRSLHTIVEQECGEAARVALTGRKPGEVRAANYPDTVGISHYAIDLHPTSGGDNYIDFISLPFQIPLGALLPVRVTNLLPANKNIGTTHITNGGYRLHPVEWNIGESVGCLVAFAIERKVPLRAVRERPTLLDEFQNRLRTQGVETHWPREVLGAG